MSQNKTFSLAGGSSTEGRVPPEYTNGGRSSWGQTNNPVIGGYRKSGFGTGKFYEVTENDSQLILNRPNPSHLLAWELFNSDDFLLVDKFGDAWMIKNVTQLGVTLKKCRSARTRAFKPDQYHIWAEKRDLRPIKIG